MHDPSMKAGVRKLRKKGRTFSEILVEFPFLSKSTISEWVSGIELNPEQEKRIIQKQLKGRWLLIEMNKKRHQDAVERHRRISLEAKNEIGKISKRDLLISGAALYWAEGHMKSKHVVEFSNSDPKMITLMMRFFRKICKIDEDKFKFRLTLHPGINKKKALEFWSFIVAIPVSKFYEPYIKPSKSSTRRMHNIFYNGTITIVVCDTKEVSKIKGFISGFS